MIFGGFYFRHDSNGNEVDVIAETATKRMPIEIKSGQTLNRNFFTGLERWMALAGDRVISPALVYGGTEKMVHKVINVFGWKDVGQVTG